MRTLRKQVLHAANGAFEFVLSNRCIVIIVKYLRLNLHVHSHLRTWTCAYPLCYDRWMGCTEKSSNALKDRRRCICKIICSGITWRYTRMYTHTQWMIVLLTFAFVFVWRRCFISPTWQTQKRWEYTSLHSRRCEKLIHACTHILMTCTHVSSLFRSSRSWFMFIKKEIGLQSSLKKVLQVINCWSCYEKNSN